MNLVKVFANNNDGVDTKEVLNKLPDSVFIVGFDGLVSWANHKAVNIFENNRKPIDECHIDEIIADGWILINRSAKEQKSIATGAFACDDSEIFVEINAISDEDFFYITVRDITTVTGLLDIAEDIGKLNKEKNFMIHRLSNEFRSPLQSINGFSKSLIDGVGGELNEKQDKYLKIINKNALELSALMDEFLEFSYAESSLLQIHYKVFDVVNCVKSVMQASETAMSAKKLEFNFEYENLDKKTAYSDENALKTVLHNLIKSSIKMIDSGSIDIKLANPDVDILDKAGIELSEGDSSTNYIYVTVSNKGVGLSDSEKEDLFNPYMHIEKSTKKGVLRALNLGTANVLTEKMSGVIWADTGLMEGTTFHLVLPAEKEQYIKYE